MTSEFTCIIGFFQLKNVNPLLSKKVNKIEIASLDRSNLKQHTSHDKSPRTTTSHYKPPRPTTSYHELPRAKTLITTIYHVPPQAKNLSAGITTSQKLRKTINHEPKLIIPDRGSFCIDYVSIRYVPTDLSCKLFQKYYLNSHSIL